MNGCTGRRRRWSARLPGARLEGNEARVLCRRTAPEYSSCVDVARPRREADRARAGRERGTPRMEAVYMDHHATTPVHPDVLARMLPFFGEEFGNPASTTHAFGRRASEAVERARGEIAAGIGAQPQEIVFTSGATESNNLAL